MAMTQAKILTFGLQAGTDRTIYATWEWDRDNTENYTVRWWYYTADGTMLIGEETTVKYTSTSYSAPSNATQVVFYVKPESKTRRVNGTDTTYWTAEWSTAQRYFFEDNPAPIPSVPSVSIADGKLTAYINNLSPLTTEVQFQIRSTYDDYLDASDAYVTLNGITYENQTTVTHIVEAGKSYRVRARAMNKHGVYSDWSEYSEPEHSIPTPPREVTELRALSETSVYISWTSVSIATGYTVEYTTDKTYFDSNAAEVKSASVDASVNHAELTGLESGDEYFFRVKATNSYGDSVWSTIHSLVIGKDPAAPTTWSSTTTAITGESVIFYWVHNAEDGSSQTYAELELTIGGSVQIIEVKNSELEEERDKTSSYVFDTSSLTEGSQILWRVRTKGITNVYGDWSIQRTIDVHAPAVLSLAVLDISGGVVDILTSFPFRVRAIAGPITQSPIGYNLSIIANEAYETVDVVGKIKMVSAGEQIYTKYFDIDNMLEVEFSAGDVILENNISYTVKCTVAMNSGLTTTQSTSFRVYWDEKEYYPDAEIGVDRDNISVYIRPYCEYRPNSYSKPILVDGITLSVYRREFDGSFTEIATGLKNTSRTFVTDPHPSLDYARYRIVAITDATGSVSYYDVPAYPIGEKAVIIQWAEEWSNFNNDTGNRTVKPSWSGSLLRLPYNIDVTEHYTPDVSLIKYIGRKHPVSYYGTQIGSTPSWNMVIDKKDTETIYALRRLAAWPGDVYVREPSGTGYWAHVTVSFSQKHTEVTIPVSLSITRVEGGV